MFWSRPKLIEPSLEFDATIPTLLPSDMDSSDPLVERIKMNQDTLISSLLQDPKFLDHIPSGAQIRNLHRDNLGEAGNDFEAYETYVWSVLNEMKLAKVISGGKPMTQNERMRFFMGCKFRSALVVWSEDRDKVMHINNLAGVYHTIWQGTPLENPNAQ